ARIVVDGAVTLYRVALDRDIHYHAAIFKGDENGIQHQFYLTPATATHPTRTLTLSPDEFFMCGDNSPASLDGRLWDSPNPWVAAIDPKMGVVNRQLVIGRAFYVYFPAANKKLRMGNTQFPIRPDFGRMRWIW
ncbi:MAG: S26 family signal peptidase, partial [bacterium]|nr:S26 family signal peptidase [bacterium]